MMPWDESRLTQAVEVADACGCGCACALDVESLVAEVRRLREQFRIAAEALGIIADRGGNDWSIADDALTQMSVVDDDARRVADRP